MIQIINFINTDSEIQNLIEGLHRQHGDCISLLFYLKKNNEIVFKTAKISEEECEERKK
jgi:hypothetical protein